MPLQEDDTLEMFTKLECRAAAVLRNLAHDPKQHSLLIQSGAVDVLADIMRKKLVRGGMVTGRCEPRREEMVWLLSSSLPRSPPGPRNEYQRRHRSGLPSGSRGEQPEVGLACALVSSFQ